MSRRDGFPYSGIPEAAAPRRIEVLRRIFLCDVPRLEALRARYRLTLPDESGPPRPEEPQVIYIVCSDDLV